MIKLINILNELGINNPNVTPEKVEEYHDKYIDYGNLNIGPHYIKICKPYCEKYDINFHLNCIDDFEKLSQSDLNNFYRKMQQIVNNAN